ncbi:MAG: PAS domain-containing sensor histidine kinase [Treponema sp.]|jgi:signal transduction histidine kinase|nr:PAS domain-containing sensor histidine kinase [Treponema sp.]
MSGFYRRALSKIGKLTAEQCRELLVSASSEILRLQTVLDSLPSGILVCDEHHSLILANKSSLRLLPLGHLESPSFLGGSSLWGSIPDESLAAFFEKSLKNGDRVTEREMNVETQGTNRLLAISILPLVDRRRITGSLIHIEDITEKRGKETRLRRAENLASLTTLAASVAHEIKNPLGAISIHLQLMQKALAQSGTGKGGTVLDGSFQHNEVIDKYFNILNEEVDRLNRIVVDFLFAVRPMSLDLREDDINALTAELAEFIRAELEQSHIRLLLELDEKVPPALIDERYMKQALLNLIKNALAAMPNGGLLTIATQAVDNEILISVCDTGIGMSAENLAKIFEPYFTTRDNGTGLGLTLVYKIIKEHHGDITVESREGEGSNFEISLPIHQKKTRLIAYEDQNEI